MTDTMDEREAAARARGPTPHIAAVSANAPAGPLSTAAPKHYSKADLLDAAKAAVADRGLNYGKPEDNFNRIARLWNSHLLNIGLLQPEEPGLNAADVAQLMALMKIARLENQPGHADSWIDLAGYAACGADIST